jgi:hypothetical protein
LFSRDKCLRTQQRRAFGELRASSGTGRQGLGGSRARSAWACSRGRSACASSSGARSGIYASAAALAAKAFATPERARRGLAPTKAAPALAAAARVLGSTRRWHRPPRLWRLPSTLGVALLSREQCWLTQQRLALGDLRIGGGGRQGLCDFRARSAWARSHENSACAHAAAARVRGSLDLRGGGTGRKHLGGSRARSAWASSCGSSAGSRSGSCLGIYASVAAPVAKALATPKRDQRGLVLAGEVPARVAAARVRGSMHRQWPPRPLRLLSALGVGLLPRKQHLHSQQRRGFWDLRGSGTGRKHLGGSRERSAWACSRGSSAGSRSGGSGLGIYASAAAPVAKVFATPERDRCGLAPTKAAPAIARQRRVIRVLRGGGGTAAKAIAAPKRARCGLVLAGQVPAHAAAARAWGATHRQLHRPPRPWRLPSALGVGLFSREKCLRD